MSTFRGVELSTTRVSSALAISQLLISRQIFWAFSQLKATPTIRLWSLRFRAYANICDRKAGRAASLQIVSQLDYSALLELLQLGKSQL
jgi:hypothetical protein